MLSEVPPRPTAFDYKDALAKSILFFEAQHSGQEPKNNRIPWRHYDPFVLASDGGWYDGRYSRS